MSDAAQRSSPRGATAPHRQLLTGNAAAAWAARLAGVDYVPAFPITPQTEIIETLAEWMATGAMPGRLVTLESEHSMVTAAGAAAATGVRVFTATSSQGLLYAMEMLHTVAGWRAPLVLVNVSRGLSAPITLEPDHNDAMAVRDTGFLQLHCSTCQEVLDTTLLAFRLGEDPRVRLPVLVNMDGFYLSFTREPVTLPTQEQARSFLPARRPDALQPRASHPISQGVAVLGGSSYSYFRYEAHLAALAALEVYAELGAELESLLGRPQPMIAAHELEGAEIAFVMIGSFATKAEQAVQELRRAGKAVGLARLRVLRPFPGDALRALLGGKRAVIVVDQNLSPGHGGILHSEVTAALARLSAAPPVLSFVGGLGGREIAAEEFYEMSAEAERAVASGEVPAPRLLFTREELTAQRKLQVVAQVERGMVAETRARGSAEHARDAAETPGTPSSPPDPTQEPA